MKAPAWFAFLASAVACALVWALSPLLTGHREPWDAAGLFYFAALAVAGSLAGLLAPKPLWAHYIGAVAGQLIYGLLFLHVGPWFILGAVFIAGYSVIAFVAATFSGYLRIRIGKWSGHA
jgi:hypothetical protein